MAHKNQSSSTIMFKNSSTHSSQKKLVSNQYQSRIVKARLSTHIQNYNFIVKRGGKRWGLSNEVEIRIGNIKCHTN